MSALSRPSVFTSETTAVRPCKLKLKRGAGAIVEITSLASLHHTARQRTAFAGDPGQTTGNDTRMSLGSLDAIAAILHRPKEDAWIMHFEMHPRRI